MLRIIRCPAIRGYIRRTTDAGATWTECTGNLLHVVTDAQTGTQFRRELVYRPGPDSTEEAVLVGAVGGLFRMLKAADGASALWTKFGSNLPNTVGRDIKYYPRQLRGSPRRATGDVLVASLLGRGAWILENASANLVEPSVLRIMGRTGNDTIRLARNPKVPALFEVYDDDDDDGAAGPRLSLPVASLSSVGVMGSTGGTTFTVEDTGGFTTALLGEGFVNALHVHGTTGPLEYATGNGVDTVAIGEPGNGGRAADVASIRGPVRVRRPSLANRIG